jgi:sarcosine oxidase subunit gamma
MPLDLSAAAAGPLDGMAASGGAALVALPFAWRSVLRGRPTAVEAAASAFGAALPLQACRAVVAGEGRAALWLGPDEWLLLAPRAESPALAAALERAMEGQSHSLVDVSNRQAGIEVSGPDAAATLNAGCPLDLDPEAFPVGMCTRTVLAKAEIVLWRTAPATFRVEVSRSFAAYAWSFLVEASREFRG